MGDSLIGSLLVKSLVEFIEANNLLFEQIVKDKDDVKLEENLKYYLDNNEGVVVANMVGYLTQDAPKKSKAPKDIGKSTGLTYVMSKLVEKKKLEYGFKEDEEAEFEEWLSKQTTLIPDNQEYLKTEMYGYVDYVKGVSKAVIKQGYEERYDFLLEQASEDEEYIISILETNSKKKGSTEIPKHIN